MAEDHNEKVFDMSSEAIDRRLRDVAQLYRLGMSMKDVAYLGKAREVLAPPPLPTRLDPERQEENG